jgi:hypothetical protein
LNKATIFISIALCAFKNTRGRRGHDRMVVGFTTICAKHFKKATFEFGFCCLTPLSTLFQLYRGGHFNGGGNRRKPPTCLSIALCAFKNTRGRRGHDRMVVGFTTICAISDYHH